MTAYNMEPCAYLSKQFLDIWELFRIHHLKNKKTAYEYMIVINSICSTLCCDFLAIDADGARRFFNELAVRSKTEKKKLSVKSINNRYSVLRSVASFIVDNKERFHLDDYSNVFLEVDIEHYSEMVDPCAIPTLEQLDILLESVKSDPMLYCIFCLVIRCGFSASDICMLRSDHIFCDDSGRAVAIIPHGKKNRSIVIPPDVLNLLKKYSVEDTDYLFRNRRNNPLTYKTLSLYVREAVRAAGFSFTLQDMRNASIAYMLLGGANYNAAASYYGISERWMYRYKNVIDTLEIPPCEYQNFRLI